MLCTVCVRVEQVFKCSTTPSFLWPFLFPSCISCFFLDYSALLPQAAHSISLTLSSLATTRASHSIPASISPRTPSLTPAAHSKADSTEGKECEERRFYSVFQISPVLIEQFCNPAPSKPSAAPTLRAAYSVPPPLTAIFPSFLFVFRPLGG